MKELAFYINDKTHVECFKNPFAHINKNERLSVIINDFRTRCEKLLKNKKVSRVYFGTEFCEHLISSLEDVKYVYEYTERENLAFSLVTPLLTDEGIEKERKILEYLELQKNKDIEIICNDWGLVNICNKEFKNLKVVLGRLLEHTVRDPRIDSHKKKKLFTNKGNQVYSTSNVTSNCYQLFLNSLNINRVEMDVFPQGYSKNNNRTKLNISAYIPYGEISTGVLCMMKGLDKKNEDKFLLEKNPCTKKCLEYTQIMRNFEYSDFEAENKRKMELIRKGRAILYLVNNMEQIKKISRINRIIYQFDIPN